MGVTVSGDKLYLADSGKGMKIFDLSDPRNPVLCGAFETGGHATSSFVLNGFIYVSAWGAGLQIIDLSDLTLSGIVDGISAVDCVVDGDIAYITNWSGESVVIVSVENKTNPTRLSSVGSFAQTPEYFFKQGEYVFVAEGFLHIIDVSDVQNPISVGYFGTVGTNDVFVVGNIAYLACWDHEYLLIVDVTDKYHPKRIHSFYGLPESGAHGVFVEDNFIYLVGGNRSLRHSGFLKIFRMNDIHFFGDPSNRVFCGNQTIRVSAKDRLNESIEVEITLIFENLCAKNQGICDYLNNTCNCSSYGYYGPTCQKWDCFGIESSENGVCFGHGVCGSPDTCTCNTEYFGDECQYISCFSIPENEIEVCGGHGKCSDIDVCECSREYRSEVESGPCTSWNCGSYSKNSPKVCNSHGECKSPDNCVCKSYFFGVDCESNLVDQFGLVSGFTFAVTLLVVCFSCCLIVILFFLCISICTCLICFAFVFRLIWKQRSSIQKFQELKDFDVLLAEQLLDSDPSKANIRINKRLFEVPYEEVQVIRAIGEGGSNSIVFLAEWKGNYVAFKCFRVRKIIGTQQLFDKFEAEVNILSHLNHPNITQFYGACLKTPRVGILMEYCENGEILDFLLNYENTNIKHTNLRSHLLSNYGIDNNFQYPVKSKIRMVSEIISAVEYIHSRNIIHRDLKPENILIDVNESCKLTDFGISRVVRENVDVKLTKNVGTENYIAPEIGDGVYDSKCDSFSFAILLWVIFTEDPSPYGKKNLHFVLSNVRNDPNFRPPLEKVKFKEKTSDQDSHSYTWILEVMKRCWDHDPKKRFSFKHLKEVFKKELFFEPLNV